MSSYSYHLNVFLFSLVVLLKRKAMKNQMYVPLLFCFEYVFVCLFVCFFFFFFFLLFRLFGYFSAMVPAYISISSFLKKFQ